jgi:hypothetical protein
VTTAKLPGSLAFNQMPHSSMDARFLPEGKNICIDECMHNISPNILCHKESKHFKRGKQIAASISKQQCNMIDT